MNINQLVSAFVLILQSCVMAFPQGLIRTSYGEDRGQQSAVSTESLSSRSQSSLLSIWKTSSASVILKLLDQGSDVTDDATEIPANQRPRKHRLRHSKSKDASRSSIQRRSRKKRCLRRCPRLRRNSERPAISNNRKSKCKCGAKAHQVPRIERKLRNGPLAAEQVAESPNRVRDRNSEGDIAKSDAIRMGLSNAITIRPSGLYRDIVEGFISRRPLQHISPVEVTETNPQRTGDRNSESGIARSQAIWRGYPNANAMRPSEFNREKSLIEGYPSGRSLQRLTSHSVQSSEDDSEAAAATQG